MPTLPASLALTVIADGSNIVAADHRNNYAAVQDAVNKLIAITANGNGIDGDAMVWDNTNAKWVPASTLAATRPRAPRVVTSTLAGGPPASPVDQDIWIATGVDANGNRWAFQYNAGSASASKWEFIGGPPLRFNGDPNVVINTGTQVAATGFYYSGGMSSTVARAGDYEIAGWLAFDANAGADGNVQAQPFAGASTFGTVAQSPTNKANSTIATVPAAGTMTGVAAAAAIGLCGSGSVLGTYKLRAFNWFLLPVRIT